MARHLYLLYLPLFAQLVQPQFLNSTLACSETCHTNGENVATCNTEDFFCFCQSTIFHETYICCVRSLCDSTDAESLTDAAASRCAAVGAAFTAVSASACTSTFSDSSTAAATSTQGSSNATGTISQNTITATAMGTVTNEGSSGDSNSASTSSSTVGTSPLHSSSSSASSGSSQGSGLSTGAKAGIGAGVGVGVLMVIVMVIVILRRKRSPNQNQPQPPSQDMTDGHDEQRTSWVKHKSELDANQNVQEYKPELDANQHHHQQFGQRAVSELAAHRPLPAEADSAVLSRPWNELHADPVYYRQLPTGENTTELP